MTERFRNGPARDFTKVGEICAPPFAVLPDPAQVFARRAERLRTLAEGHALAPFLIFLSRLVDIQHQGLAEPAPQIDRASVERAIAHGMPALSKNMLVDDDDFSRVLDQFLRRAVTVEAPLAAAQALARVMAMSPADRLALAASVFDAAYPVEQIGEVL
ncbi:formate dehydrogenase accessory protein FdhE, partial [Rhodoblastus sp.]|uniref:formate dehydrogenase accessory protein FdhE domain-containing protein n=1 Tax=Rhodoblastus sp. TaxID=1962975 RepID=UPI0035B243E2